MWHGEGLVLDDYPVDWADARAKAGLLWEPEARETFQRITTDLDNVTASDITIGMAEAGRADILRPLPDHKLIVRNEDLKAKLGDDTAVFIITNPNTLGLFETNIKTNTE